MNDPIRRSTWMIGDCLISCEPKITSMVTASVEKDKAPRREAQARGKAKGDRNQGAKSKRV